MCVKRSVLLGALVWAGILQACDKSVTNEPESVALSSATLSSGAQSSSSARPQPPWRFSVSRPPGIAENLLRDTIALVNADGSLRVLAVRDTADSVARASLLYLYYNIDTQGPRSGLRADTVGACTPRNSFSRYRFWPESPNPLSPDDVVNWCALRPLDAARVLELELAGNFWEDAQHLQGWALSAQGELQRLGATLDSGKLAPLPHSTRYALWENGRSGEFYLFSPNDCNFACSTRLDNLSPFLNAQQIRALPATGKVGGELSYFEPWLPRDRVVPLPRVAEKGALLWDAAAGVLCLRLRGDNFSTGTHYGADLRVSVAGGTWERGRAYGVYQSVVDYLSFGDDGILGMSVEAQTLVVDSLVAGICYGRLQLPPDAPQAEWSFAQPYREEEVPEFFTPF